MSDFTTLVLDDRQATPISHSFVPVSRENGIAEWSETDGTPLGDNKVTASVRRAANDKIKSRFKLVIPVTAVETVNGIALTKVVRVGYADISFTFDSSSTQEERDDLVGMTADALSVANPQLHNLFVNLQSVY